MKRVLVLHNIFQRNVGIHNSAQCLKMLHKTALITKSETSYWFNIPKLTKTIPF